MLKNPKAQTLKLEHAYDFIRVTTLQEMKSLLNRAHERGYVPDGEMQVISNPDSAIMNSKPKYIYIQRIRRQNSEEYIDEEYLEEVTDMKGKKTFKYCEHCNTPIEDVSPPSYEQYEQGVIDITTGRLLLPKEVAEKRTQPGYAMSHAESLDGCYCNLMCLHHHLLSVLNPNPRKETREGDER